MKLTFLHEIPTGSRLAIAVFAGDGSLLLPAGTLIIPDVIKFLQQHRIIQVYVVTTSSKNTLSEISDRVASVDQDINAQAALLTQNKFSMFQASSPYTAQLYQLALDQQKRAMISNPGAYATPVSSGPKAFQLQAPKKADMKLLLEAGGRLGTLPTIFSHLIAIINNPYASSEQAASIIATDPALAARLLRLVNSPFYGLREKIDSIPRAVTFLGMKQLSLLAMSTVIMSGFKGIPSTLLRMQDFWSHSISCGVAARFIANRTNSENQDSYFVAGLLHDIGHLLIFSELPQHSLYLLTESHRQHLSIFSLEKKVLGFTHEELGAELLRSWNSSPLLVEYVEHHGHSVAEPFTAPNAILPLANTLSNVLGFSSSGDSVISPVPEATWEILSIAPEDLSGIAASVTELIWKMRALLMTE